MRSPWAEPEPLQEAIRRAGKAGEWRVVEALAHQLEAKRASLAAENVVDLQAR